MTAPISGIFSTTAAFLPALPSWYPEEETARRIEQYNFYYSLYWGEPSIYKVSVRDSETPAIFVPAARTIIDTTHRYFAKGIQIIPDPTLGSTAEQDNAKLVIEPFLRRERFYSRFSALKRTILTKGDGLFLITADSLKPEGSRISLTPIDPSTWIPTYADARGEHAVGADLIEVFKEGDDFFIRRQRWMKSEHPVRGLEAGGRISYQVDVIKQDDFNKGEEAPIERTEVPEVELDPLITALPVYHYKNFEEDDVAFGSSEIRGVERLAMATTMNMSDADIAIALQGIGLYATDSGAPTNSAGDEIPWTIAPGQVLELGDDKKFVRVPGVTSMDPYHSHIDKIMDFIREATGTPSASSGKVDVNVAESGISLYLQMSPMLAKVQEKDTLVDDVNRQLFFDLKAWFKVYEGVDLGLAEFMCHFGPKLPENVSERIKNIVSFATSTPPIISISTAQNMLREQGYQIPTDEVDQILIETSALATEADPTGGRLDEEATGENVDPLADDEG